MTRRLLVAIIAVLLVTAGAITAAAQSTGPATRFAFVARGDNPIDALAAAPVAGRMDAPVVLTPPSTLATEARSALTAANPDVVVIAGGTSGVSEAVADQIRSTVPDATVRRVAGSSLMVVLGVGREGSRL